MAKYLIDESTLEGIADEIREMSGDTQKLSTDSMISTLKDSNELIERISKKFFDIKEIEYIEGTLEELHFTSESPIRDYAFYKYDSLKKITLHSSIKSCAFQECKNLHTVDIQRGDYIGEYAFSNCTSLTTLIIRSSTVINSDSLAMINTPINNGNGYIYVPKALIEEYKVAENWDKFKYRFRAIDDYPEICGGT